MNSDTSINIYIEKLILDGLPVKGSQGPIVQAAVEAELARLLVTGELSPQLLSRGALPSVWAEAIQVSPQSGPGSLGTKIAWSVYEGIAGTRSRFSAAKNVLSGRASNAKHRRKS